MTTTILEEKTNKQKSSQDVTKKSKTELTASVEDETNKQMQSGHSKLDLCEGGAFQQ